MRLLTYLLCVMLAASGLLVPLSSMHAHVSGQDYAHVRVHDGHSHDIGDAHSDDGDAHERDSGQVHEHGTVVNLKPDLSRGNLQAGKAIHWIAVLFVVALVVLQLRPVRLAPRPPRTRTRPPSPYPHILPLLRGPPVSI